MPQLVKGGKYIFGLSKISKSGNIVIPPEAAEEYGFKENDKVILFNGSRTSGGFIVIKFSIVERSKLGPMFKDIPGLVDYQIPQNEIIKSRGRSFCWTTIKTGDYFILPQNILETYQLNYGDLLAIGRGSNLGLSFIARGIIHEEALKHSELEIFSP